MRGVSDQKSTLWSSCCGAKGLEVSLQRQHAGWIPSPAQWVKGSGIATAAMWVATMAHIWSLAWKLYILRDSQTKKKKKEKKKKILCNFHLHILNHTSIWGNFQDIHSVILQNVKKVRTRSSHCGSAVRNLTRIHEDVGLIPGLAQWVKDLVLQWLWCRPAAVALIQPLAWKLSYAPDVVALKKISGPEELMIQI